MNADTSVLILFARIGRLELLRETVGNVNVPEPVHEEAIRKGPATPDVRAIESAISAGWITTASVAGEDVGRLSERFPNLGLGETACLALAQAEDQAAVLFDDADARRAALILGLQPIGCLGIIARAFRTGVLPDKTSVSVVLRALLDAGLWVSADVVERFWDRLDGRP